MSESPPIANWPATSDESHPGDSGELPRSGPAFVDHPDAVGLGQQGERASRSDDAEQPADGVPLVAADDDRTQHRGPEDGAVDEREAVLRHRRLGEQRPVLRGHDDVGDAEHEMSGRPGSRPPWRASQTSRPVGSPVGSRLAAGRQPGLDPGAAGGARTQRQRAVGRLDAVAHVRQPGADRWFRVEAHAVVLDGEGQPPRLAAKLDPDRGRARVLCGVLHGLQATEVRRGLHGRRNSARRRTT